jgi:hypothetical protein
MRTGHSRNRAMHTTLIGLLVQVAARSSLRFFNKPFRPVSYDLFSTQGFAARVRVSDLLCMIKSVHVSPTKEHDDDDNFQQNFRRAA